MAEALGTVHTRGGELVGPIGPKLVFDQMAVPVPEIVNNSLYNQLSSSLQHNVDSLTLVADECNKVVQSVVHAAHGVAFRLRCVS
jgi:hypothetical protein